MTEPNDPITIINNPFGEYAREDSAYGEIQGATPPPPSLLIEVSPDGTNAITTRPNVWVHQPRNINDPESSFLDGRGKDGGYLLEVPGDAVNVLHGEDEDGNLYATWTDADGDMWRWSMDKLGDRHYGNDNLVYTDKDGLSHEVNPQNYERIRDMISNLPESELPESHLGLSVPDLVEEATPTGPPLDLSAAYEEYAREDSYIPSELTIPSEPLYTDRFDPSEYVSLNPQPLPPGPDDLTTSVNRFDASQLDPNLSGATLDPILVSTQIGSLDPNSPDPNAKVFVDPATGEAVVLDPTLRDQIEQHPNLVDAVTRNPAILHEIVKNPDLLNRIQEDPAATVSPSEPSPSVGVPYRDYIPFYPMVKDPVTGEWRNTEPGEIPGVEGNDVDQPPTGETPQDVLPAQFGEVDDDGDFTFEPQPIPPEESNAPLDITDEDLVGGGANPRVAREAAANEPAVDPALLDGPLNITDEDLVGGGTNSRVAREAAAANEPPVDPASLNPQPLPPEPPEFDPVFDPTGDTSLNPQPLPPEPPSDPFDPNEAPSVQPEPEPAEAGPDSGLIISDYEEVTPQNPVLDPVYGETQGATPPKIDPTQYPPDLGSAYEDVTLNPQPLPPEPPPDLSAAYEEISPEDSILPQEPTIPGEQMIPTEPVDPSEYVALNPQPLPPEPPPDLSSAYEEVALNPQPLPPEPPEVTPFAAEAAPADDLSAPGVQPPVVEPTVIPEDPALADPSLSEPIAPTGQEFDEFSQ